ncbi:hypothetical protein GCM10008955_03890 [Deinococcus malanensis]|uniref:Cell division protein FtsL n=1 Tax=Deinococcus malanensis TaxID=1706855 RepID=A0ABQ2EJK5_9DEIO|nr:hypothetical protein [Deinococcus malanensis]GGK13778.1 hypothetical protein GCM10008955_03890 [Deinococcus malanensis]
MMARPPAGRWSSLDLSFVTWRGRAVRYVLIYLALAVALVGVRMGTQQIRPGLISAQEREAELISQRDDLQLRIQILENPQLIRDWAFANGMQRFAQAPNKTMQDLPPAPTMAARPAAPKRTVEVRTQWK